MHCVKPLFFCALLLLFPLAPAGAQIEHEQIRQEVISGKLKPLDEILQAVGKRHPGRIVDIDLERGPQGQRWYEITIVNGQRIEIYVDAVTGEELRQPASNRSTLLPLSEILRRTLLSQPGTVVQAELEDADEPAPYYELTVLTASLQELVLRVDAQTGQPLNSYWPANAKSVQLTPLAPLLDELEQRYKGKVTEVELKPRAERNGSYYEIDLQLGTGRGMELHVDAVSGKVLDEERGR